MTADAIRPLLRWSRSAFCVSLLLTGPGGAQPFFESVKDEIGGLTEHDARGQSIGDYDNDGWPDLLLSKVSQQFNPGPLVLFNSLESRYFAQTATLPPDPEPLHRGGGPLFGDYDNDGDLDVFGPVGQFWTAHAGRNSLLRNDRGTFVDVTEAAGLRDVLPTDNAIWLDYDRDGWLDLYTGNLGAAEFRNKLYRNRGDSTFADVTAAVGLDRQLHSGLGGSNAGMAASDFDGDGWPDLYVGVSGEPNHLFLNREGTFVEIISNDMQDQGIANGITVGDIDNDGRQDIFQSCGGGGLGGAAYRPQLYLNLGDGAFIDVLEGVGLGDLPVTQISGGRLVDIDNDGDLDLLTSMTPIEHPAYSMLYINDGSGRFSDATEDLGYQFHGYWAAMGDYDLDGFLDVLGNVELIYPHGELGNPVGLGASLFRNRANGNHWLRVDLVGVESNRDGIGAQLTAVSGELRQMRELLGGSGFVQDELVAHFGLGTREQVDELKIRWPSGRVDVLSDIPADRKIRVIEGRGEYYVVHPTVWESAPPDSVVAGSTVDFQATVRPALFEPDAEILQVTADLRELGGPEAVELVDAGDGAYWLASPLTVVSPNGRRNISVTIDQTTSRGPYWTRLSRTVAVLPAGDLVLFGDALLPDWELTPMLKVEIDPQATARTYRGSQALELRTDGNWRVTCRPAEPLDLLGYDALRFTIHPGDAAGTALELSIGSSRLNLLSDDPADIRVDLEDPSWQVIEIPLATMDLDNTLSSIAFSGRLEGILYLDDIRLVAATPPAPITAVLENRTTTRPESFTLDQNFPNPFNSSTSIRFGLSADTHVELSVFNLAGQQVVTLIDGARRAGTYTLTWDGRDDSRRELASGVYLYRLRTGDGNQIETRKLVLMK